MSDAREDLESGRSADAPGDAFGMRDGAVLVEVAVHDEGRAAYVTEDVVERPGCETRREPGLEPGIEYPARLVAVVAREAFELAGLCEGALGGGDAGQRPVLDEGLRGQRDEGLAALAERGRAAGRMPPPALRSRSTASACSSNRPPTRSSSGTAGAPRPTPYTPDGARTCPAMPRTDPHAMPQRLRRVLHRAGDHEPDPGHAAWEARRRALRTARRRTLPHLRGPRTPRGVRVAAAGAGDVRLQSR